MNKITVIILLLCILPLGSALGDRWDLVFSDGTTTINGTDVCLDSGLCLSAATGSGTDTNASTACGDGEYLDGGGDCINLNNTIDDRDSDTTYTNGTGMNLIGDTFSIALSYFQGLFLQLSGGTMVGDLDMNDNNILDVDTINITNITYVNSFRSYDGNSIYVQPTGDEDDYFTIKTPSDRPTIKREGGKFIYFESSNLYDVGVSFRKDDTYSGTLAYAKDDNIFKLLGKDSPIAIVPNSEYLNYILFETFSHQPQISVFNGTKLIINDSLEVIGDGNFTGNITSTYFKGDGSLLTNLPAGTTYSHLTNFTDDLGDRGYTHLGNFSNDLGIGNWSDDKSDYSTTTQANALYAGIEWDYNQTIPANSYTDAGLAAQDACSEITGCIENAITDGNTNWDNSYGFIINTVSDLTNYYTKTIIDSLGNFSAWDKDYSDLINTPTLLSNFTDDLGNRGYTDLLNFTNGPGYITSYTETDPLWSGNSTTVARAGDCPSGQYVQNTTTSGVECAVVSSGEVYYAGIGTEINASNNISVSLGYRIPQGCADGEIAEYNTTSGGWDCGIDNTAASGMASWILASEDTAGSESITDGETVTFADDEYLNATRSTNTITYSMNEAKLNATINNRNLSEFNDDLGDRGYTSNLNFTNDAGYYNQTTVNSSELEHQGDGKIGILDSFINSLIDNRITQSFIKALGFYDDTEVYNKSETYSQTEINNNLTNQDECSEITGCVENAITVDTNASTACSTTEVLLGNGSCADSNNFYDDTTIGNCSVDNSCSDVAYDSEINKTYVDAQDSAQDACSEITGCIENAITDGNTNWDNSYGFITDGDDSVNTTELDGVCATDDKILKRLSGTWQCVDETSSTDTNASTACGDGEFLNGDGSCDSGYLDADGVDDDTNRTDQDIIDVINGSAVTIDCDNINFSGTIGATGICDGDDAAGAGAYDLNVSGDSGNGAILDSEILSIEGTGSVSTSMSTNTLTITGTETDPFAYNGTLAYLSQILGFNYYNLTDFDISDYYNKTETYTKSEINNNLTNQDECSEITGCVENAITDGNTNWDNSYGLFDNIANFTGTLTDGKICIYDSASQIINCTYTDQSGEIDYSILSYVANITDFPTTLSYFTDDILWTSDFNNTGDERWSSTYNATYDSYNSTGLIKDWNADGYIQDWNSTGYIKDWNNTGLIINWSDSNGLNLSELGDTDITSPEQDELLAYETSTDTWFNTGLDNWDDFTGFLYYYTKSEIEGFNYYNLTDFDIDDYRLDSWNNFTGIPTATPNDGDTTHLSTAGQIYTWVTGLLSSYWDTSTDLDTVISDDEIAEGKIELTTTCGTGNHLYINGNDFACEADQDNQLTEDQVEAIIFDNDNTDNLNMSDYNVTSVDCIVFTNGAELCGV